MDAREGVALGESRIRLTWARVLDAAGEHERAHAELAMAAERLLARAAAIADPELRASFLRGIPENARTLEAAGVGGGS